MKIYVVTRDFRNFEDYEDAEEYYDEFIDVFSERDAAEKRIDAEIKAHIAKLADHGMDPKVFDIYENCSTFPKMTIAKDTGDEKENRLFPNYFDEYFDNNLYSRDDVYRVLFLFGKRYWCCNLSYFHIIEKDI